MTPLPLFTFHYASTYTKYINNRFFKLKDFTFHYASTYTGGINIWEDIIFTLHSTMLLLIPNLFCLPLNRFSLFTFHYASTYTSTGKIATRVYNIFTFHYASTYTKKSISSSYQAYNFTFHYASTYTAQKAD